MSLLAGVVNGKVRLPLAKFPSVDTFAFPLPPPVLITVIVSVPSLKSKYIPAPDTQVKTSCVWSATMFLVTPFESRVLNVLNA